MALEFDDRCLLAPGVHDATMDEVKAHFGQFQRSDRRMTLFAKLAEYVDALKQANCGQSVILDGSFVMACIDEPDDIDIVLVLPADWDMDTDLKPYQYNLVSNRVVRKTRGFDLFSVEQGSIEELEWIRFFGLVRPQWCQRFGWPENIRKGMIRVRL